MVFTWDFVVVVNFLREGQPFLWVFCEYLVDDGSGDSPILHLGYNVLQDVAITMTTIAHLGVCTCACWSVDGGGGGKRTIVTMCMQLSL